MEGSKFHIKKMYRLFKKIYPQNKINWH